jgi:hypothetical protein
MLIGSLYSVAGEVVFYSPNLYNRYNKICIAVEEGAEALDVFGNIMSKEGALASLYAMSSQRGNSLLEQAYANITLAPLIISIVRAQLISNSDGVSVMSKLSSATAMVQCGMFYTASLLLENMVEDEVLTRELLDRWVQMLRSADSLPEGAC